MTKEFKFFAYLLECYAAHKETTADKILEILDEKNLENFFQAAAKIRSTTCSNGQKCDYCICGDKDPYLKDHPEYRDGQGYRRNK